MGLHPLLMQIVLVAIIVSGAIAGGHFAMKSDLRWASAAYAVAVVNLVFLAEWVFLT